MRPTKEGLSLKEPGPKYDLAITLALGSGLYFLTIFENKPLEDFVIAALAILPMATVARIVGVSLGNKNKASEEKLRVNLLRTSLYTLGIISENDKENK